MPLGFVTPSLGQVRGDAKTAAALNPRSRFFRSEPHSFEQEQLTGVTTHFKNCHSEQSEESASLLALREKADSSRQNPPLRIKSPLWSKRPIANIPLS
jgi:hypothetical protein